MRVGVRHVAHLSAKPKHLNSIWRAQISSCL